MMMLIVETHPKNALKGNPQRDSFSDIPHIDGIHYQEFIAADGRPCVLATGNTQVKKELLKGAGFQWNPQRKMWWKYADIV